MIEVFEELLTEIEARSASCETLIKNASPDAILRLRAKADTYDHCAEMLRHALERARVQEGGAT